MFILNDIKEKGAEAPFLTRSVSKWVKLKSAIKLPMRKLHRLRLFFA